MFTKFNGRNKGFTLIELLVVISIIGLLSSIVLASLQSAKQKANAASVVEGMNQLKNAFELYKTDTGHYPNEGVPSVKDSLGWWGEGDPISYLSSVLNYKYISSIKNNGSAYPGWGSTPVSVYVTGGDWYLYYEDASDSYYATCGGIKLKGYLFEFYSSQPLNYPQPGYYYEGDYYPFEPLIDGNSTNWYCIGGQ